jgi:hypothetical protein
VSAPSARRSDERERAIDLPELDEGTGDDGGKEHVEEGAARLLRGSEAELAVINGERGLSRSLVQQRARQVIVRDVGRPIGIEPRSELLRKWRRIQRSRSEQMQQRAKEHVEEDEPRHAVFLRDRTQAIEGFEALPAGTHQRRVIAQEHQPAGAPERREFVALEERPVLRDDARCAAKIAGEIEVLQQLRRGVGSRHDRDVLLEQRAYLLQPLGQHRVRGLTQHRREHQRGVDAQPFGCGSEHRPSLQQALQHGDPRVQSREARELDIAGLDDSGGGQHLAEFVVRRRQAIERAHQHRSGLRRVDQDQRATQPQRQPGRLRHPLFGQQRDPGFQREPTPVRDEPARPLDDQRDGRVPILVVDVEPQCMRRIAGAVEQLGGARLQSAQLLRRIRSFDAAAQELAEQRVVLIADGIACMAIGEQALAVKRF